MYFVISCVADISFSVMNRAGSAVTISSVSCSRRHVHRRHPHKLPHDVCEQKRRGGVAPLEDRRALPARLVRHRPGRSHSFRSAALRIGHG